jgi:hypothetical protein
MLAKGLFKPRFLAGFKISINSHKNARVIHRAGKPKWMIEHTLQFSTLVIFRITGFKIKEAVSGF